MAWLPTFDLFDVWLSLALPRLAMSGRCTHMECRKCAQPHTIVQYTAMYSKQYTHTQVGNSKSPPAIDEMRQITKLCTGQVTHCEYMACNISPRAIRSGKGCTQCHSVCVSATDVAHLPIPAVPPGRNTNGTCTCAYSSVYVCVRIQGYMHTLVYAFSHGDSQKTYVAKMQDSESM